MVLPIRINGYSVSVCDPTEAYMDAPWYYIATGQSTVLYNRNAHIFLEFVPGNNGWFTFIPSPGGNQKIVYGISSSVQTQNFRYSPSSFSLLAQGLDRCWT